VGVVLEVKSSSRLRSHVVDGVARCGAPIGPSPRLHKATPRQEPSAVKKANDFLIACEECESKTPRHEACRDRSEDAVR
jgi:hypothetical protein